jgi:type I restriction enzyme S subunit
MMRPIFEELSPFLELFLNSPEHGQAQYREWIYGEGRPHLSFDHLRATAVLIPSLFEQQEIVRRVQGLFKLANAIEQRIEFSKTRVEKLTQITLTKAFSGKLVPTEAELARREGRSYESAGELLRRIRAERESIMHLPAHG